MPSTSCFGAAAHVATASSPRVAACRGVQVHAVPGNSRSRRSAFLSTAIAAGFISAKKASALGEEFATPATAEQLNILNRVGEYTLTDEQWKSTLGPDRYSVLRKAGTERPFSSALNSEKRTGTFVCAGCGAKLFSSDTKYNSGTGWPSFYTALPGAVDEVPDNSIFFMPRTEVRCHRCQGHLGHVFPDGPEPTGLRYCMNGLALQFEPSSA